jgi:hypothetical protein
MDSPTTPGQSPDPGEGAPSAHPQGTQLLNSAYPSAEPAATALRKPPEGKPTPLWLQRLWVVLFVVLCIELGLVLVVVPWTPAWHQNSLLSFFGSGTRNFLLHPFVRGAISGVGLLDLWIGIGEAVNYRENPR